MTIPDGEIEQYLTLGRREILSYFFTFVTLGIPQDLCCITVDNVRLTFDYEKSDL